MALLNRPLTEDEARKMAADWRVGYPKLVSLWQMIRDAEPTPHVVRYSAADGRVMYVPPTTFYWARAPKQPSDCEWIIPGTM